MLIKTCIVKIVKRKSLADGVLYTCQVKKTAAQDAYRCRYLCFPGKISFWFLIPAGRVATCQAVRGDMGHIENGFKKRVGFRIGKHSRPSKNHPTWKVRFGVFSFQMMNYDELLFFVENRIQAPTISWEKSSWSILLKSLFRPTRVFQAAWVGEGVRWGHPLWRWFSTING